MKMVNTITKIGDNPLLLFSFTIIIFQLPDKIGHVPKKSWLNKLLRPQEKTICIFLIVFKLSSYIPVSISVCFLNESDNSALMDNII